MTHKIQVVDFAGENAIRDGSEALFDVLFQLMKFKQAVELDFTGVRILTTTFVNVGIAQLIRDFDSQMLNENLKITNISPVCKQALVASLENAKRYYNGEQ